MKNMKFFQKNLRYVTVIAIFTVTYLINSWLVDEKNKSPVNCVENNCEVPTKNSILSNERPELFIPDIIVSQPGYYYRLIIRGSINRETSFVLFASSSVTREQKEIGIVETNQGEEFFRKEFVFRADKKYNGLVLQKKYKNDGADVFVKDLKVTKLNIKNDREMASLRQSVLGFSPSSNILIAQTESDIEFAHLKENNTVLGQVFKAESENIFGVAFDINVLKTDNRKDKKYRLELRRVVLEGDIFTLQKGLVASFDFKVNEIESYKQSDGKIKFPIYGKLKKGEYYFIGINNKRVDTNEQNYLILKGTSNNRYINGGLFVKNINQTYLSDKDIYFKIYGIELNERMDKKILLGMLLEDLGRGQGSYVYKSLGYSEEILDLHSFSQDIGFNKEKNVLFGNSSERGSFFEYKFDTRYNFKKFRFLAKQAGSDWEKVSVLYSFDRINWQSVAFNDENGFQEFDQTVESHVFQKTLYLKIVPKDNSKKIYGIKNLAVNIDLIM